MDFWLAFDYDTPSSLDLHFIIFDYVYSCDWATSPVP